MKKNSRNKNKRPQTPKSRNEGFMRATLDHANSNLTVPSKAKYSRKDRRDKSWAKDY